MKSRKGLSAWIVVLLVIITATGIFSEGVPFEKVVTNAYGDEIVLYGQGIYAYESVFKAPIFIGTDIVILFVIVPAFIFFQWVYKRDLWIQNMILLSFMTCFMYYALSLAFGVAYNTLFLGYLILFSLVFFRMWQLLSEVAFKEMEEKIRHKEAPKGVRWFLIIAGAAVFVWLVEIIQAILTGRPPTHIAMNTTEPTFVKDLALILPLCWLSSYWIGQKKAVGAVIGSMMLGLCGSIGVIVTGQSIVQWHQGVIVSTAEMFLFVVPFVVLSVFSFGFYVKLLKWSRI